MTGRIYPDESVDSFPQPPLTFTDAADREVVVRRTNADGFRTLVEMYLDFDPADRAQGIPPVKEAAVREWLETMLSEESLNVVAWHDDAAVGHAMLVPDEGEAYELAVFVLGDYQSAGIGTQLLEGLLGLGQAEGVEKVWLTVERWNDPAIRLYRKLGFEPSDTDSFEMEMSILLG